MVKLVTEIICKESESICVCELKLHVFEKENAWSFKVLSDANLDTSTAMLMGKMQLGACLDTMTACVRE